MLCDTITIKHEGLPSINNEDITKIMEVSKRKLIETFQL